MTFSDWLLELDTEFLRVTGKKYSDFTNKDWFPVFLEQTPIPVVVALFLKESRQAA